MTLSRAVLRAKAKKLYKEQTKGVPKKQRVPFSEFFKRYKDLKPGKIDELEINSNEISNSNEEDFDFENIININEISENGLETPTLIKDDNKKS